MSDDFIETTTMASYRALKLSKQPFLIVMSGKNIAHRYPLNAKKIVLGRTAEADIVLDDPRASRLHARIVAGESGSTIEDMDSTNGTYVNNQKISAWSLMDGDLIAIGGTLLKFSFQSEVDNAFHEEIVDSARIDGLTGLLNRRFFQQYLREEFERIAQHSGKVSLLLCDLDDFKKINDTYGHPVGDLVLKLASRAIQDTVRETDRAGRYGGEELAVILPQTGLDQAIGVAEKIRAAVENLKVNEEQSELKVTVSIGVASSESNIHTVDALIKCADDNLYQAKANGKNQVIA